MKVLIVGKGGREHTLVWKIAQSSLVEKIYCAPGNAGIAMQAECISIGSEEIGELADFAEKEKIDLTVVGPEGPLVNGIGDEFEKRGLRIFAPSKEAAIIEGSKVFAKELMKKYKIPTADFRVFDNAEEAIEYANELDGKCAVKADGLAAGKGVIVCNSKQEAEAAVRMIVVEKAFGDAGNRVIIEELLVGEEASILAFSDGESIKPMVSSQDHKRVFDDDKGPNTGGMGAYSPAPVITKEMEERVMQEIMQPTIDAMRKEGRTYKGILYAGLMIKNNELKVLEFNARFGDPETQVVLPRLESDLVPILNSCIDGTLQEQRIEWTNKAATCVVLASGGYPGLYEKGIEIKGLDAAAKMEEAIVFHAGTKLQDGKIVTDGGRVLGVTALGETIKDSVDNAYKAVSLINFEKMHYRKDIGKKALDRL